jgi:hypothetical protein
MMGLQRYLWGAILTLSLILGGLILARSFLFESKETPPPPRHVVPKAQAPVLEVPLSVPQVPTTPTTIPAPPPVSVREASEIPQDQPPEEKPLPIKPPPVLKAQSPRRIEATPPEDEPMEWTEDAPEETAEASEQPAGPTEPPDLLENGF